MSLTLHLFSLPEAFEQLDTCSLLCTLMPVCIIGLQTMKELELPDGCMMVKETSKF